MAVEADSDLLEISDDKILYFDAIPKYCRFEEDREEPKFFQPLLRQPVFQFLFIYLSRKNNNTTITFTPQTCLWNLVAAML